MDMSGTTGNGTGTGVLAGGDGERARRWRTAVVAIVAIAVVLGVSPAQAGAAPAAAVRAGMSLRSELVGGAAGDQVRPATDLATAGKAPPQVNAAGYPYAHAVNCAKKYGPQSWCIKGKDVSPLGYKYRSDTDYVAWIFRQVFGISLAGKLGSAGDWAARLKADGYGLSRQPRPGDIAIWPGGKQGPGHVAYVFAVSQGSGWLDEYDVNGSGKFSDDRTARQIAGSGPVIYASAGSASCSGTQQLMLPPAIATNPKTGLGFAAAVGPADSLYVYWQSQNSGWNGPYGLDSGAPGIAYSAPAIIIDPTTGRPVVMAVGPNNSMYAYWQNANGLWSGPYGLGQGKPGIAWSAPAIGFNSATGLITALAEGPSATLYAYWRNAAGQWSGPGGVDNQRPGIAYSAPAIAETPADRPVAVADGPSDSLYSYWQDNSQLWVGPLGVDAGSPSIATSAGSLAIAPSSGQRIALADGPADRLYAYTQTPGQQWSAPIRIDGGAAGIAFSAPAVGVAAATGRAYALAVGTSRSLFAYWQNGAGQWQGPGGVDHQQTGLAYSAPAMAEDPLSGLLVALAVGPSNSLYVYWQDQQGNWVGPLGIDQGIGCIAY